MFDRNYWEFLTKVKHNYYLFHINIEFLKMQFDFGFRFDIGKDIGSGHFFRCFSIAEKLIESGFKVIFLVNNKQQIEHHLKDKKISFHVLKNKSDLERVTECKILVKNISKLVIDLPFYNEMYSKLLKNDCETIIIDDIGNKKIYSKLLINGSIVKEFQKYFINSSVTEYFSGTKYIILRSEFKTIRNQIKLNKKIKKILLIFGGSDENNLTGKILPYFLDSGFNITVVLGPSYRFEEELKNKFLKNQSIKIIHNKQNIGELFAKQDLVISSSGITAYELACLGIPSILIPTDKYQIKTSNAMEKIGFGINYGYWDDDFSKLSNIISVISSYSTREKMYFSGRSMVDGKGIDRILEKICEI